MTYRDLKWRAAGAVIAVAGCALGAFPPSDAADAGATLPLLGFAVAIAGLVLLIQGKRVPLAFRIERSRHRQLPQTIRVRYRATRRNFRGDAPFR